MTGQRLVSGRILVISPHFDDAALSLGTTIARAVRLGARVTVLTVFGDDPTSATAAGPWDRQCGFSTVGEAAMARRLEDERACAALGAATAWLPFGDEQYARGGTDDDIWTAIEPHLRSHDTVLVPGYPLDHRDHVFLTELVLRRRAAEAPVTLYVEQPYATARVIGRAYTPGLVAAAARLALRTRGVRAQQTPVLPAAVAEVGGPAPTWGAVPSTRADRRAKANAVRAYDSQLAALGRHVLARIRLYEWGWGGECVSTPLERP